VVLTQVATYILWCASMVST